MQASEGRVGTKINNYQVLRLLGQGGMGAIYEVEHALIGKRAALKLLHEDFSKNPDAVERFFTEAQAVNKIRHQNIIDITDYGHTEDKCPYFLMELLEGKGLDAEIEQVGAMELRRAVHIIKQIASALRASHRVGILHRDLKPENIFLIHMGSDDDFVKVLDFGIAKLLADPKQLKTEAGRLLGTPQYMAPEQITEGVSDHRADIYALGLIFYELLLGEQLVQGTNPADVMVNVVTKEIPDPAQKLPKLSAEFQELLRKATQRDPAKRHQDMIEFSAALTAAEEAAVMRDEIPRALVVYRSHVNIPVIPRPSKEEQEANALQKTTTTLSLARRAKPFAEKKAPLFLLAAGGVAMVAFGGALALMWPKPEVSMNPRVELTLPETAPASTSQSVTVEVESQPVTMPGKIIIVEIISNPPGATLTRGKTTLGKTPYKLKLQESESVTFKLSLEGYEPLTKTLKVTEDRRVKLTLTPEKKTDKKGVFGKIFKKKP